AAAAEAMAANTNTAERRGVNSIACYDATHLRLSPALSLTPSPVPLRTTSSAEIRQCNRNMRRLYCRKQHKTTTRSRTELETHEVARESTHHGFRTTAGLFRCPMWLCLIPL